jgi:hypothetical protein
MAVQFGGVSGPSNYVGKAGVLPWASELDILVGRFSRHAVFSRRRPAPNLASAEFSRILQVHSRL